jgi:hypothetical protein
MTTHLRSLAPTTLTALLALAGCTSTPAGSTDAGPGDTGSANDAAIPVGQWQHGPDYPVPIAFGAAMILPDHGTAYLYVVGGTGGAWSAFDQFHSEVYRSPIQGDNSLGPWEPAGHIDNGMGTNVPLAGHHAIRIFGDMGEEGLALAGGGTMSGLLPFVMAGYIQMDGSLGQWGRFDPILSSMQGGQAFGTFDVFETHQLVLVGGLQGTMPTDHVEIAAIQNGSMSPTWRDGPPLPAARYGHGSIRFPGANPGTPDTFVIGGAGTGGPLMDVLVTTRDAAMEVNGWSVVGSFPAAAVFPATALVNDHAYVIGGVEGDPVVDALSTHVRMATVSQGAITSFADQTALALPEGRAGALVASVGPWVYLVGGLTGTPHAASASVVFARLEN